MGFYGDFTWDLLNVGICWDLLGFVGISHQIIGIILGRMGMNYENINYIWGFPARHGGTTTLDGL